MLHSGTGRSMGHMNRRTQSAVRVVLTAYSILESATSGSTVGVLSVANHPSGSSGWTFTKTADPDAKFAVSGTNLNTAAALDYETKTAHTVTITASKAAQANVVTTITVYVTNVLEVTLGTVALSGLSYTTGSASSGTITGKTAGSTLSLVGSLPSGLTINLGALTWAWSGNGAVGTGSFTIRETHPDGINSPKDNAQSWTIAYPSTSAPVLTRTSSAGAAPLTWDATNAVASLIARLQVATDSGFTAITQDYSALIDETNISGTDLLFPQFLTPSGTYYLRMRYERDDGTSTAWSNTLTDTISAATTVLSTTTGTDKQTFLTVTGSPALSFTDTAPSNSTALVRSTKAPATNKSYCECLITALSNGAVFLGFEDTTQAFGAAVYSYTPGAADSHGITYRTDGAVYSNSSVNGAGTCANGDYIGMEADYSGAAGTHTVTFYKRSGGTNSTLATVTGLTLSSTWRAFCGVQTNAASGAAGTMNFGQSAFARTPNTGFVAYG